MSVPSIARQGRSRRRRLPAVVVWIAQHLTPVPSSNPTMTLGKTSLPADREKTHSWDTTELFTRHAPRVHSTSSSRES
eukprot:3683238-Rhodomonas_salina.1